MLLKNYRREVKEKTKEGGFRQVNRKMVLLECDSCGAEHSRTLSHYKKMQKNSYFDKDYCNKCWRPILAARPGVKERAAAGVRRAYLERGDIIKKKISTAIKGTKMGDENPMRRPEVREKVSQTRSQMMKDPREREKYRQGSIDAHARGCYIGSKCGRTKWYDYAHSNGTVYKVQGTWELAYIEWLDQNNVRFECHKGRIPYIDDAGIRRNFYPDFYLIDSDEYIDVKGDFWYSRSIRKFELLREQHPDLKLTVLRKKNLQAKGINIK